MDQFTVILPETKILSNFTTKLPQAITLEGAWEVGVSEITLTQSVKTFIPTFRFDLLSYDANNENFTKVHSDKQAFVEGREFFKEDLQNEMNAITSFYFGYDPDDRTDPDNLARQKLYDVLQQLPNVKIENNKFVLRPGILLNNELIIARPDINFCRNIGIDYAHIMKFSRDLFSEYSKFYANGGLIGTVFREPVIFTSLPFGLDGIKCFNVYTDICQHGIVGTQLKSLLRRINMTDKNIFGDQVIITFDHPQYSRVITKSLSEIQINIKECIKNSHVEEQETFIPFQFGEVIVTLHFRQISTYNLDSVFRSNSPIGKVNPLDTEFDSEEVEFINLKLNKKTEEH